MSDSAPVAVVERFLERLSAADVDGAVELLADDLRYENTGLPTVRGRERVRRIFGSLNRLDTGFDVYMHAISAQGPSVLTERTDVLSWGRLRVQFWVCGRFDVREGRIALWRDRFDYMTTLLATLRGLVGVVVPAARARPPKGA